MNRATLGLLLTIAACEPVPGEPCTADSACGDGLLCSRPVVDGGPAAMGVCAPALTPAGGHCSATAECARGFFCSNDLPAEVKRRYGTCIAVQSQGQPCFRHDNCSSGLVCTKDGGDTGTCTKKAPAPDSKASEGDAGAADGTDMDA